jgi:parallel beta-helix repeat protein
MAARLGRVISFACVALACLAGASSSPAPTPAPPPPAGTCGSLQALVNAAAAGSTVTVPACTYRETVTITKPLTLRGYGSTIDGGGVRTRWLVVAASDVTVEGFTMQGAAAGGVQSGSLDVDGVNRFTARDLVLRGGSYAALRLWFGSGHRIEGTTITDAPSLGIIGWHVASTVMTGNHIAGNNTARFDAGWEAGGIKLGQSSGVTFSDNEVDHNAGKGFWCDGMCTAISVTGNRIHDNSDAGIFFEISSGGTITGNRVWENGWAFTTWGWGAGITISSSADTEVAGNIVAWNADGIAVLSQSRSDAPAVTGNNVHDNTIALAPQPGDGSDKIALGFLQDWSGSLFTASANNRGSGNDYWVSTAEPQWSRFGWNGAHSTLAAFNGTPGEEGGVYLGSSAMSQVLSSAGVPTAPRAH